MSTDRIRAGPIRRAKHLFGCLVCLIGLAASPRAAAEDPVSKDWQYKVTPYAWLLAIEGHTRVKGIKVDLDVSFSDILDEINYGVMVEAEARKGRLGFTANVLYANLGNTRSLGPIRIDPDINQLWASLVGYYRLGPWDLDSKAGTDGPHLIVDPYAGIRYTYLDVDVDFSPGPDLSSDQDWVDPIIGLRTIWQLSPRWSVVALGDIGGFGVGSDFQWQATGLAAYRFSLFGDEDAKFLAGYRALYQDYSTGSGASKFEWDATLHGPILALNIKL